MWIFGPLPCSTISPVTVTFARAAASLVTVSQSTSRMAGRGTLSPAPPCRRLIVNVSPTATLCWLPPAFTTAYTTELLVRFFLSSCARPERSPGAGRAADAGPAAPEGARSVAVQPDQRTRAAQGRSTRAGQCLVTSVVPSRAGRTLPDEPGGPAGRLAARRRRGRPAGASTATGAPSTGATGA